ncbi:cytochrome c oxidase subunit 1 [Acetobacter aceti NRIC 0242]|uniref:Cytochrome c oxidase subunit 1 n=1 Tax=Acetobacter aceti NBRC 14818 TaxID=887700 RepID=A0AB33IHY1_ACEAC|nr:hypothetical protein [Acetobacter aceti]TCS34101.1 heme/copper-type cytochrome/quinol oxidase subunit 1 [Acetobacter aceti NBRC 14818]BCK75612.1 hypothetical protein EMQ_1218 [Acetobacter aceti NBRC 14818]GAN56625.1 cytochrome c oxidase subunit 1 [Acetobacter aceti NBRC 14818]GBO79860.1 cytochrome c oxidase subunit 1 [Acetobacter aceti NRIC 0242]
MAVVTPAQTQSVNHRSGLSPYAAAAGYLALSVTVGGLAGAVALASQLHVLPAGLEARMAAFHPTAMLLFVGVPAFLGAFGRLFLARDLMSGGVKGLPLLDSGALTVMLLALLMFLSSVSQGDLFGMGLWSVGAILMSASTLAIICDSRAGAGIVAPRGQERVSGLMPFSLFVWTQLCATIGLLLVAPVLAAGATRELLGASDVMPHFEMPATLIVLVSAFGLAARVFDGIAPVGQKLKAGAVAVIATVAIGGPALWDRMAFVHADPACVQKVGTILAAVAAVAFAGIWIRALWRQAVTVRVAIDVPVLWVSGFFVLLAAGWMGSGVHTAVLNGAVFVLFGGFYAWLNDVTNGHYSRNSARAQFGLMFFGVLASDSNTGLGQALGGAAMAVSLGVLAFVLLNVLSAGKKAASGNVAMQEIRR